MSDPVFLIQRKERIGFLTIAALMALPVAVFLTFFTWVIHAPLNLEEPQTIQISRGDGFLEIGNALAAQQVVRNASLFRLYVLSRGWAGRLKPGEYAFAGTLAIPDVARVLVRGPEDVEITLPEGLTFYEMEERLVAAGLILPGEFVTLAYSPNLFTDQFPFLLDVNAASLEGFLFPDTYYFNPETGARAIIEKMLTGFEQRVFRDLESRFRESPQSILDIITMASMLEREAANFEDRAIISDILWRRLEAGMRLQVDATVIYAWRRLNPRWAVGDRNRLSFADLQIDSPYNTYRVRGMPPGPIANPGLDSIRAALEPQENEYWFYLAAEGITYYSRTFAEHTALKARLDRMIGAPPRPRE